MSYGSSPPLAIRISKVTMKLDNKIKNMINYLFKILEENKICELGVSFYGSGDDGNMEIDAPSCLNLKEPTIFPLNDAHVHNLDDLILEISDYILDKKSIDYSNGAGNNGAIVYTTEGKKVTINYLVTKDAEYNFSVK